MSRYIGTSSMSLNSGNFNSYMTPRRSEETSDATGDDGLSARDFDHPDRVLSRAPATGSAPGTDSSGSTELSPYFATNGRMQSEEKSELGDIYNIHVRGAELLCRNVGYSVKQKQIIQGVNLAVRPGQLLSIVGCSGAGKTTLLSSLTGRNKKKGREGSVHLRWVSTENSSIGGNGHDNNNHSHSANKAGGSADAFSGRPRVAYVTVDARLLPYLTVEETLMASAHLRLPSLPVEDRRARVDQIISQLGLQSCRHSYIGGEWKKGISTGERKRVNIGVELLSAPAVLVLDEPTSGLDSTLACELLHILRRVCSEGDKSVICTLHQPTSQMFALFDQLLLFSRGRVFYSGDASEAKHHFARLGYQCPKGHNPADFFLTLLTADDQSLSASPSMYGTNGNNAETDVPTSTLAVCENERSPSLASSYSSSLPPPSPLLPSAVLLEKLLTGYETTVDFYRLREYLDGVVIDGKGFSQDYYFNRRPGRAQVKWDTDATYSTGSSPNGDYHATTTDNNNNQNVSRALALYAPDEGKGVCASSCCCSEENEECCEEKGVNCIGLWFLQLGVLFWRTFRNSIRNPVVSLIMILIQALQGIILGGIFWQLSAPVRNQEPFIIDDVEMYNNPWTQLFVHGIDGRQPLLEALENGVDGNGSQPLLDIAQDTEYLVWLQQMLLCSVDARDVSNSLYYFDPSNGYAPFERGPGTGVTYANYTDKLDAQQLVPGFARLVQWVDFSYMKPDWACVKEEIKDLDPTEYWATVTAYGTDLILNFPFECYGAPPLYMNWWGHNCADPYLEWKNQLDQMQGLSLNSSAGTETQLTAALIDKTESDSSLLPNPHKQNDAVKPNVQYSKDRAKYQFAAFLRKSMIKDALAYLTAKIKEGENNDGFLTTSGETPTVEQDAAAAESFDNGASAIIGSVTDDSNKDGSTHPLRKLITLGDLGLGQALREIIGDGMEDVWSSGAAMLLRARSCGHRACKWVNDQYGSVKQKYDDSIDAVMALVNMLGALFFLVANLGFCSFDALLTFPQERALFNRESGTGLYHTTSYFIAKNLADFPFQFFPSFVISTIFYLMSGMGGTFVQYATYVLIVTSISFAAYGFGYLVSALSPRMEIGVFAAPVILVIWLTTAGFFLRDDDIPKWIAWFSTINFYKWGFFSLVNNQFREGSYWGILSNDIPIIAAGVTERRLTHTISNIVFLGLGYRVCAFFALKFTNRKVGISH